MSELRATLADHYRVQRWHDMWDELMRDARRWWDEDDDAENDTRENDCEGAP